MAPTIPMINIADKRKFAIVDQVNKHELAEIRYANLLRLLNERFDGRQADFAAAIKKNPTQVNHWFSRHRNPNGDTCRAVEASLDLPLGWLDRAIQSPNVKWSLATTESAIAPATALSLAIDYQPLTVATVTRDLANAMSGLSESRRKTVAGLIAGQITDGALLEELAAIDALTAGVTLDGGAPESWRKIAFKLAERHPDPVERERLVGFVHLLVRFIGEQAGAQQSERAIDALPAVATKVPQ